jgi:8-oxo-dGTP pyrophosphatase MutT (NUDIX family)
MPYLEWIRSRLGHRKIILAYASVVLRDPSGRLLLQRRTDFDLWGLPGGVLEVGEDIQACARRELLEETGLTAGKLDLLGLYTEPAYDVIYPNGDQVQQFTICFHGEVNGGRMLADGVETRDQAFFHPDDIPYHRVPAWYKAMIQDSLRGGGPFFGVPSASETLVDQAMDVRRFVGHDLFIGAGAIAIVIRNDGSLLVTLRSDDGQWGFPSGYVHLGENAAHTAQREALEETGIRVEVERILGIHSPREPWHYPNGDKVQPVFAVFRCRLSGGTPQVDGIETEQVDWVSPEQVLKLNTNPLTRKLNQLVLEHLDGGCFLNHLS